MYSVQNPLLSLLVTWLFNEGNFNLFNERICWIDDGVVEMNSCNIGALSMSVAHLRERARDGAGNVDCEEG